MTREQIIRMARDCGINFHQAGWPELERFAALVAAAEREACARECWEFYSVEGIAQKCNAAIRARGTAQEAKTSEPSAVTTEPVTDTNEPFADMNEPYAKP